eukprot:TRINITY_DN7627_c0_g1_i2.p1 TRINITY_DN7627_c0_g1~~TRINITY_DN7627_c0_g1_i2.p1  ORF type:complete len:331 (+),score=54.94 TRINITY_DN7627_c0_g1_i2:103-993(+)
MEGLTKDLSITRLQRDDFDRKFQHQLGESQAIQGQILELEKAYNRMKQKYEDEIYTLRRHLGTQAHGHAPSGEREPPSGPLSLNTSGNHRILPEKRTHSSLEGSAGSLDSLPKRHRERELPMPQFNSTPTGSLPQGPPLSISQIAKQAGTPKRISSSIPSMESGKASSPSHTLPGVPQVFSPANPLTQQVLPPPSVPAMPPSSPHSNSFTSTPNSYGNPQAYNPNERKKREVSEGGADSTDWVVGHNPDLPQKLEVSLLQDLPHDSVVCSVSFSQDGRFLATGCNRLAQIYDVNSK